MSTANLSTPRSKQPFMTILFALLLFAAGTLAMTCSGYANVRSFFTIAPDEQSGVFFAIGGLVAAIAAYSGYSIASWKFTHTHSMSEGWKTLIMALIASCFSMWGTAMFLNNKQAQASVTYERAEENREQSREELALIRHQLAGFPPGLGTSDSYREYMDQVEAQGLDYQRPYRMAVRDHGLAVQKERLEARLQTIQSDLQNDERLSVRPPAKLSNAMLFAALLEILSALATGSCFSVFAILRREAEVQDWLQGNGG